MEDLSSFWRSIGLEEVTINLLFKSWAPSSLAQYNCALRKWGNYCRSKDFDPLVISESKVANFLASLAAELSFSSINVIRAALSVLSRHLGNPASDFPLVSRLMKGIFRQNPSVPKYAQIWKVSDVLNFLLKLGDNEHLSLKNLSFKTVMLCALASPRRVSELAALTLATVVKKPDHWHFPIPGMTKNRRIGGQAHSADIFFFPENPLLCPIKSLEEYIVRTALFRGEEQKLFVSFRAPHKAVNSTSIARWIKSCLTAAGITGYGAHSTRAAATSTASASGISSDLIMRAACWSEKGSTFEKFYKKSSTSSHFQRSVLE